MTESSWRDEWPPLQLALIDETALCVLNQLWEMYDVSDPGWDEHKREKLAEMSVHVAGIFLAREEAAHNLTERGVAFEP
jgi:hypothetical protein